VTGKQPVVVVPVAQELIHLLEQAPTVVLDDKVLFLELAYTMQVVAVVENTKAAEPLALVV
jgi:hypothetical protein